MKVVCPECASNDERSTVQPLAVARTLMAHYPFYDKDGDFHNHDPNYTAEFFKCSRGHEFSVRILCACGWPVSGPYAQDTGSES